MPSDANSAFNRLQSDLNKFLRPQGFRRSGQRFGRETEQCWQIIGLQKSRYPGTGEVRFTINFGVTSKVLIGFKGKAPSKMPLDWECPIRCRIGELLETDDVWWSSNTGDEFQSAFAAITAGLSERALPFLDGLRTDAGILALYHTGLVMGFEIDRDETRAVLLAHSGLEREASLRVRNYEERWLPSAVTKRASAFLTACRARFGFVGE